MNRTGRGAILSTTHSGWKPSVSSTNSSGISLTAPGLPRRAAVASWGHRTICSKLHAKDNLTILQQLGHMPSGCLWKLRSLLLWKLEGCGPRRLAAGLSPLPVAIPSRCKNAFSPFENVPVPSRMTTSASEIILVEVSHNMLIGSSANAPHEHLKRLVLMSVGDALRYR